MNIYYALWADAINYERIRNGGAGHWKVFTFSYMSILLSLNIMTLLSLILFLTDYDITSKIYEILMSFQSKLLRDFIWAIVVLFIPSMVVTYFFVFHKKKYEYILSKYKFRNGRLLLIYFILTVILMFGFSLLNK
jgi:hypothetical protein